VSSQTRSRTNPVKTPATAPPSIARPQAPTPAVRSASRRRRARRRLIGNSLANIAALIVFVVMIFPIYWMVSTAFKPGIEILSTTPHFVPLHPTLANFSEATSRPFFWSSIRNSVVIVTAVVLICSAVAFLAAVAVARFNFRGRKPFIVLIVAVQMVPLVAMIIPIYLMLNKVGLTDRLAGVAITYLTFVLPFTIWTLRGFVINVPKELEEAAMVDGLSRASAFVRILFPLIAPGLVATGIFAFIQAWNEYVMAYVLLSSPEKQTATVWLASFTTKKGTEWGPLMAGATIMAIPVIVFFMIVQRRVTAGLTAGAVKG
jgi:N,N'-diacetylchitobiose transport system permease protein